jgi:hypothetical protein
LTVPSPTQAPMDILTCPFRAAGPLLLVILDIFEMPDKLDVPGIPGVSGIVDVSGMVVTFEIGVNVLTVVTVVTFAGTFFI